MAITKASFALISDAPANVKDFGAVGDGINNDRLAIQAAFDASLKVYFPEGTYYVGQLASGATAIDLRGKGDNITILTQGFVELVCETTNTSQTSFFIMRPTDGTSSSHFYCDPIRFRDTGFVSSPARGATGFLIQNGNSNWGNLRFIGIYGKDIYSALQFSNSGNSDVVNNRIRGIFVDELFVDNGIYGVSLSGQGDGCYFKKIKTNSVYRPLFAYNVQSVEATVFSRNNKSTSGAINLGWFTAENGPDLSGIKVRYVSRECSSAINHILINVIGPSLGTIKGIDLDIDIEDAVSNNPAVNFVNYATSGGPSTPTTLSNTVTDIIIRGRVNDATNVIKSEANYTAAGLITLLSSNIPVDSSVYNNFIFSTVRSYATTWSGSSSNPTIGNGSLTSNYSVFNGMCQVNVALVMGSTTTFGSGTWSFTLPITSRSSIPSFATARAYDSGSTTYYSGSAYASGTVIEASFSGLLSSSVPITWATGDTLYITVNYPI